MKEPLQAAKILYANGSSEYMYASTYICHKFNLQEAESYGYFCMEKCLSGHNFSTLYKIFDIIDSLKVSFFFFFKVTLASKFVIYTQFT